MKPGPKPTLPDADYPGIYAIVNKINGKQYIGSALSITGRLNTHRKRLRFGRHENLHLQAAWTKYGEKSFKLLIIQSCSPEQLVEREQYWIDTFKSADRQYGYNKCPTAGNMLGFNHSEESKQKMSKTRKGKPVSEEMRIAAEARAKANKGKSLPAHVLEAAAKVNRVRMKAPKSEETKAKMAAAARARWARAGEKERLATVPRDRGHRFAKKSP